MNRLVLCLMLMALAGGTWAASPTTGEGDAAQAQKQQPAKAKSAQPPQSSGKASSKGGAQRGQYKPSERIRADQTVAFPADI